MHLHYAIGNPLGVLAGIGIGVLALGVFAAILHAKYKVKHPSWARIFLGYRGQNMGQEGFYAACVLSLCTLLFMTP